MKKYLNNKSAHNLGIVSNNRIFTALMVFLVMISVAHATDLEYVFKLGSNPEIQRPCFNTGPTGWCSATAVCQLNALDDTNNIIVAGANMTNQISFHNYTLPSINSSGIFKVDMACSDNNQTGYDTFYFGVNDAGSDYSKNNGTSFLLGVLVLMMVLFGFASYFLNDGMRLAFLLLTFLMLPIVLWVTGDIVKNTFMSQALVNVITGGFVLSTLFFFGMLLYAMITLTMNLKIQKNPGQPELGANYGHSNYVTKRNSREEE